MTSHNDLERARKDVNVFLKTLPWVAILALALVLGTYAYQFYGPLSDSDSDWGEFGDYVGGVLNPTIAFLALLAILQTLRVQSVELRLSVDELGRSTEALRQQHEAIARQTFETTLFKLLERQENLVQSTKYLGTAGRLSFRALAEELRGRFHTGLDPRIVYDSFYTEFAWLLGHYFRALFHVFKFIDTSTLPDNEKRQYTNLARAQLSSDELTLLFYNGISEEGAVGFRPLLEKYGLLKHVNRAGLARSHYAERGHWFTDSAFQGLV